MITYYKVIQGNYGFGWDDEDFHQTNSQGAFNNREAREAFRYNLKSYRENGGGAYRVIRRREVKLNNNKKGKQNDKVTGRLFDTRGI